MSGPVRIYTDGAYSSKHDVGGWGLYVSGSLVMRRGAEAGTTNNRMELKALAMGIAWALVKHRDENVIIVSDSQYALGVIQTDKRYSINAEQIEQCRILLLGAKAAGMNLTFEWVKGHAGNSGNILADWAATKARDDFIKRLALVTAKT